MQHYVDVFKNSMMCVQNLKTVELKSMYYLTVLQVAAAVSEVRI